MCNTKNINRLSLTTQALDHLANLVVERRGRKLTLKPWFHDSPPGALARENRSVFSVGNKPSLGGLVGVPYLKKTHSITGCVI